jgi:hypothetical protein
MQPIVIVWANFYERNTTWDNPIVIVWANFYEHSVV